MRLWPLWPEPAGHTRDLRRPGLAHPRTALAVVVVVAQGADGAERQHQRQFPVAHRNIEELFSQPVIYSQL